MKLRLIAASQAYTIGRTSSYDQSLSEHPEGVTKLGRIEPCLDDPEGYPGGWVWHTKAEANRFRLDGLRQAEPQWDPETFSVYLLQLQGSWASDVSPDPNPVDGVHNLLVDATILRKV